MKKGTKKYHKKYHWFIFPVGVFAIIAMLMILLATTASQLQDERLDLASGIVRQNITTLPVDITDTELFADEQLGIAFQFPSAWGRITHTEEQGIFCSANESDELVLDGTVNYALQFSGVSSAATFIVGHHCGDVLGHDSWFGDTAVLFTSAEAVTVWCQSKDNCDIFTNSHGIRIAHGYTAERKIDEYAIFHPQHNFSGLIFSNERLIDVNLGRQQEALRSLVDSLQFLSQ